MPETHLVRCGLLAHRRIAPKLSCSRSISATNSSCRSWAGASMTGQDPAHIESAAAAVEEAGAPHLPWWSKAFRWRPTSKAEAAHAEKGLLGLLKQRWEVQNVVVGPTPNHTMHTLSGGSSQAPALVMMPGYGAGTGFFWRNLDGLAAAFRVYAVDWLGTGLSGRPPFEAQSREQAEDFFLDSLNTWRQRQGLDSFVLMGHSLGGYLAASYALRHPEQVQHLVLVCPAGVPPKPDGWESRFFTDSWSLRAQLYKMVAGAWNAGVTPGSLIRALGPWGPGLVEGYVSRRFTMHGQQLAPHEVDVFKTYFYHITSQRGSGEYVLRHLLAPGAWAYAPLQQRLMELKVPVTFIYGQHDWMDPTAGMRLAAQLDSKRERSCPSDHTVEVVPDSGHYVFIEQPEQFNKAVLHALSHGNVKRVRQAADAAAAEAAAAETAAAATGGAGAGGSAGAL